MPKVRRIIVYDFEELSDSAKSTARDWARQNLFDHDWFDSTYEQVITAAECLGLEIGNIYFRGFWSQGDGACFEGTYQYREDWELALEAEFGGGLLDTYLQFGQGLEALQQQHNYRLSCTTKHSSNMYYHSGCMDVDVTEDDADDVSVHAMTELTELMRRFADHIYRTLEADYYAQTADDAVDELIVANEYEFDERGNRI